MLNIHLLCRIPVILPTLKIRYSLTCLLYPETTLVIQEVKEAVTTNR